MPNPSYSCCFLKIFVFHDTVHRLRDFHFYPPIAFQLYCFVRGSEHIGTSCRSFSWLGHYKYRVSCEIMMCLFENICLFTRYMGPGHHFTHSLAHEESDMGPNPSGLTCLVAPLDVHIHWGNREFWETVGIRTVSYSPPFTVKCVTLIPFFLNSSRLPKFKVYPWLSFPAVLHTHVVYLFSRNALSVTTFQVWSTALLSQEQYWEVRVLRIVFKIRKFS